jgi:hypothetical protein
MIAFLFWSRERDGQFLAASRSCRAQPLLRIGARTIDRRGCSVRKLRALDIGEAAYTLADI